MTDHPIYVVREDGKLEQLGVWIHAERRLELGIPGFPFLGPGSHTLEDELPWIFWDMAPSGYMGARFAKRFPELRLPEKSQLWGADHALRALSERGEDLTGNLIVGDTSKARFFELAQLTRTDQQLEADAYHLRAAFDESIDQGGSSLGGDRPKVAMHFVSRDEGGGQRVLETLVKFTPPLETPAGRRWNNLLQMEAACAATLSVQGIAAAGSIYRPRDARGLLIVTRFDRTEAGGRVGAATLQWLAASRGEAELSAPQVLASLHRDGLVDAEAVRSSDLVHAFSAAIGNTDAHLGNYGLTFDVTGVARLAPIYDVLPMVLAPRHDELPDARIRPRALPVDPRVESWFASLVEFVRRSDTIDQDFKELWFRYVGA